MRTSADLDKVAQAVVRYSKQLIGMPHHFGIHAGGIVISEKPLTYYTALHRPPKGFPVTQFSMLEAEDLGLHKFDILSQRGLGHIRDAVEMVNGPEGNVECRMQNEECRTVLTKHCATGTDRSSIVAEPERESNTALASSAHSVLNSSFFIQHSELRQQAVDIHAIDQFKNDPKINALMRTGNTIGCFYVESPAMRMLLKKLKVDDYLGLVAASSIIRPGVAESGMMREYILRHNDLERRKQAPKALYDIMPETYGVMVYQEDVMRVAHQYAGLDLEDADQLRRGMNIRYRDRPEFKLVQKKFFANCSSEGLSRRTAGRGMAADREFRQLQFRKRSQRELRRGELPEPVPEGVLPVGVHGGRGEQLRRVLPHGVLPARGETGGSGDRGAVREQERGAVLVGERG